jgi:hypothetical protein
MRFLCFVCADPRSEFVFLRQIKDSSGEKAHKDYCPTDEHLMKFQDQEAPANFPEMAIQEAKRGGLISPAGKGNLKILWANIMPWPTLPRTTTRLVDPANTTP